MAKITVHVFNYHSVLNSHIEIWLENKSEKEPSYYEINRWLLGNPGNKFQHKDRSLFVLAANADSKYQFDIEAEPNNIVEQWVKYYNETKASASILGNNCAVAAQWFLEKFAKVHKPSIANVSWNHVALGILWPSFIPCPVTLPGRIMSNAKFYQEIKQNPSLTDKYNYVLLYTCMALSALLFAASIAAIVLAANFLTAGLASVAIVGAVGVGVASTYGFFKANNMVTAKKYAAKIRAEQETESTEVRPEADNSSGYDNPNLTEGAPASI